MHARRALRWPSQVDDDNSANDLASYRHRKESLFFVVCLDRCCVFLFDNAVDLAETKQMARFPLWTVEERCGS